MTVPTATAMGRQESVGIISHLILDLLTHGHDVVLWPGLPSPKLGLGSYETAPFAAFIVTTICTNTTVTRRSGRPAR